MLGILEADVWLKRIIVAKSLVSCFTNNKDNKPKMSIINKNNCPYKIHTLRKLTYYWKKKIVQTNKANSN
jgi:hypothetical protein